MCGLTFQAKGTSVGLDAWVGDVWADPIWFDSPDAGPTGNRGDATLPGAAEEPTAHDGPRTGWGVVLIGGLLVALAACLVLSILRRRSAR